MVIFYHFQNEGGRFFFVNFLEWKKIKIVYGKCMILRELHCGSLRSPYIDIFNYKFIIKMKTLNVLG